ncbi:MAG: membrane protein insertase YidC [Chloroflexi bacterium]|nr:membrane protein insertase YidC [Chloroflexota bacterium]
MSAQAARPVQVNPKQLRKSLLTWLLIGAAILVISRVGWGTIWREGLIRPMLNTLLFLYAYLGRSFVIAIAVFTILLRLITLPLTIKQVRASRKMAEVQPKMAELQKKYGGDKERLVQEQQRLYKEAGVSPLGGCLPTLIQFPIWIGLYQSINSILADTPLELMSLAKNVYGGFRAIVDILPLQSHFLWLNLARPDPTPFVLPVLVAGTMWLQQKLMTQPATDPQQASMNQTMQLMMPLMFGYFTTQFSSGLAIYFVISNVIGIVMQWAIERLEGPIAPKAPASSAATGIEKVTDGKKARKAKR